MPPTLDTAVETAAARPAAAGARAWLGRIAYAGIVAHALFVSISIAGMQIALAVSLGALVALKLAGERIWARSPLDLPLLGLCGAALFSLGLASLAGEPPVGWHEATLWRTVLSPIIVLSVLELRVLGDAPARRRLALVALVTWAAAVLIPSALAWIQYYTGLDALHALGLRIALVKAPAPRYPGRFAATGFFHWYQRLAHNLTPPLFLAAAVAAYGGIRGRSRQLLALAAAAAATAVVLTLSRAAWLSLGAGGAILALLGGRRVARWAVPGAVAVALVIAVAQPGIRARLFHSPQAEDNADRMAIWHVCAAVVRDHPLTGVGFGNLPQRSGPYYARLAPSFPLHAWCHDSFFSAWAEGGPVLFGALVLYWFALFRAFVRWRRRGDALARAAAAGLLAGVAAMLLNSLGHDILYASETMYGLGFALGIGAALARGGQGNAAADQGG